MSVPTFIIIQFDEVILPNNGTLVTNSTSNPTFIDLVFARTHEHVANVSCLCVRTVAQIRRRGAESARLADRARRPPSAMQCGLEATRTIENRE